jgi:hypothetical protein
VLNKVKRIYRERERCASLLGTSYELTPNDS